MNMRSLVYLVEDKRANVKWPAAYPRQLRTPQSGNHALPFPWPRYGLEVASGIPTSWLSSAASQETNTVNRRRLFGAET